MNISQDISGGMSTRYITLFRSELEMSGKSRLGNADGGLLLGGK